MKRLLLLLTIVTISFIASKAQIGSLPCVEGALITGTATCSVVDSVYGCDGVEYTCADDAMYNHGITHYTHAFGDPQFWQCHGDFAVSISGNVYSMVDSSSFGPSQDMANYTYLYDFGDGSTSTDPNPTHTYSTSGYFVVCLTFTDVAFSCTNTTCRVLLAQAGGGCTALFTDSTYCGLTTFNDLSSGTGYLVDWDFGDLGTIGNQPPGNITHQYAANGTYQVHMFIHDVSGSCNSGMTDSVTVVLPTVSAGFSYTTTGSPTDVVTFTNTSSGATSYYWDLGDGDTTNSTNPVHDYDTCVYTVQLTAIDANGCLSAVSSQTIDACDNSIFSVPSVLNSISIYPNPAKEDITVVLNSSKASNVVLTMKDVTGREVIEARLIRLHGGENNYNLTLPNLSAGVYLIQVNDDLGVMNKSVLVR